MALTRKTGNTWENSLGFDDNMYSRREEEKKTELTDFDGNDYNLVRRPTNVTCVIWIYTQRTDYRSTSPNTRSIVPTDSLEPDRMLCQMEGAENNLPIIATASASMCPLAT